MGQRLSRRSNTYWMPRVTFMGLYQSGKSTLLDQFTNGDFVPSDHTILSKVEIAELDGPYVGCRENSRAIYRLSVIGALGAVYVIDSCDRDRLGDAFLELHEHYLVPEVSHNTVCMVLANKQDLDGAMTAQEVEEELKNFLADKEPITQTLFVLPVSATTSQGLREAFSCFLRHMELKKTEGLPKGLITVDPSQKSSTFPGSGKESLSANKPKPCGEVKKALKNPFKCFKSILFY